MHNVDRTAPVSYRERLSPSLWLLVSAAVCAPMAAVVFSPIDTTLALVVGLAVGVLLVGALIVAAPRVSVEGGVLRVGRAHIPVSDLGAPEVLTADAARTARGAELGRADWHLLRGGIDGVVRVPVVDAEDPTARWVFSSRTPDRVAAMITRAQRGL
ncbi:DUF3093 domain-containing protein [Microbacterium sp. EYE_5]|uniref:DUF3093 domain-containing protein n=1 Tax=unclassified Microbacterium TaxID=2609290 RepID=UPI0020033C27|nr:MULTISPECIES: DUF3093 domain-containing protein [unclassified Microbacterium]MCK6080672.1 DUF3093 domain-containing protein [Microbacterium sp. EYE_382]MCK6085943.1 DUF3093 domain-containing protein [Microbacterium sp. EYE_384]MCK6124559.1 DUF3093 domain-containing protein [Microbacterium sp. EYE_80]MCK6127468.1 DUF3093 domain-containing protein [Microbacterium sp. EYE_79]MCK6141627.1 DUF3093 domain-containing protein [Microbacterium sp. EYE_39]